jgi:hypothetical protein
MKSRTVAEEEEPPFNGMMQKLGIEAGGSRSFSAIAVLDGTQGREDALQSVVVVVRNGLSPAERKDPGQQCSQRGLSH